MAKIIKSAKGTFTASNITIDGSGRVITAASGAGAANMKTAVLTKGPASGTYSADPSASKFQAILSGGGGGGGAGAPNNGIGGAGGSGGFGFFSGSVSGGTDYSWSVGGSGNCPNTNTPANGNSGGATNVTNLAVTNAGGGGVTAPPDGRGSAGAAGNAPGASANVSLNRTVLFGVEPGVGNGGNGAYRRPNLSPQTPGNSGSVGGLWLTTDEG